MCDIAFEVVSYDVNGIGDDRKRRKKFNFLKKQTSNKAVIFMQEIHSTKATEKRFEYQWGGKMLFSHGTSNSTGVCICFRYNLEHKIIKVISDAEGRYIIANTEIQGNPYAHVNFYAPNTETGQIKTFQDLANRLSDLDADPECNYIFGGDWNLTFHTTMDSMGGGGCSPKLKEKSIFHLRSIMFDYDLVDIYRLRSPGLRQFIWRRKTPLTMRRLDFFLISNTLQSEIKSCEHLFPLSSDHTPVKIHFCLPPIINEEQDTGNLITRFLKIITF